MSLRGMGSVVRRWQGEKEDEIERDGYGSSKDVDVYADGVP